MQPSLDVVIAVLAVVVALAAVALAAYVVVAGRTARTRMLARAEVVDRKRPQIHDQVVGLRGRVTSAHESVERVTTLVAQVDRAQRQMTERLAGERVALERATRERVLPAARWLSRLGILFRIIRLRRDLLG